MPSTAVYTRTDGIVRWHTCIDTVREQHENIEVLSSHSGLGWNPASVFAILDRLQQPEGDWRPFRAPLPLRSFYPRPETWTTAAAKTASKANAAKAQANTSAKGGSASKPNNRTRNGLKVVA